MRARIASSLPPPEDTKEQPTKHAVIQWVDANLLPWVRGSGDPPSRASAINDAFKAAFVGNPRESLKLAGLDTHNEEGSMYNAKWRTNKGLVVAIPVYKRSTREGATLEVVTLVGGQPSVGPFSEHGPVPSETTPRAADDPPSKRTRWAATPMPPTTNQPPILKDEPQLPAEEMDAPVGVERQKRQRANSHAKREHAERAEKRGRDQVKSEPLPTDVVELFREFTSEAKELVPCASADRPSSSREIADHAIRYLQARGQRVSLCQAHDALSEILSEQRIHIQEGGKRDQISVYPGLVTDSQTLLPRPKYLSGNGLFRKDRLGREVFQTNPLRTSHKVFGNMCWDTSTPISATVLS